MNQFDAPAHSPSADTAGGCSVPSMDSPSCAADVAVEFHRPTFDCFFFTDVSPHAIAALDRLAASRAARSVRPPVSSCSTTIRSAIGSSQPPLSDSATSPHSSGVTFSLTDSAHVSPGASASNVVTVASADEATSHTPSSSPQSTRSTSTQAASDAFNETTIADLRESLAAFRNRLEGGKVPADARQLRRLIGELEQTASVLAGLQMQAIATFDTATRDANAAEGYPPQEQGRGVSRAVALATRCTPHRGAKLLATAKSLTSEMPHLFAGLYSGRLSAHHTQIAVDEGRKLPTPQRRALFDKRLAADLAAIETLGPKSLRRRAQALVDELHPASAAERFAEESKASCYVELEELGAGMSRLSATMPSPHAAYIYTVLEAAAGSLPVAAHDPATGRERLPRGQAMTQALYQRFATDTDRGSFPRTGCPAVIDPPVRNNATLGTRNADNSVDAVNTDSGQRTIDSVGSEQPPADVLPPEWRQALTCLFGGSLPELSKPSNAPTETRWLSLSKPPSATPPTRCLSALPRSAACAEPAKVSKPSNAPTETRWLSLSKPPSATPPTRWVSALPRSAACAEPVEVSKPPNAPPQPQRGSALIARDTRLAKSSGSLGVVPVTIDLVISDKALLGYGQEPATVLTGGASRNCGSVPAAIARALIANSLDAQSDEQPLVWLRKLYVNDHGNLIATSSRQRFHPEGLATMLRLRDQGVCRTPWCDAPIRHADHVVPWSKAGKTTLENSAGQCVRCNQTKEAPGWQATSATDAVSGQHRINYTEPTGEETASHSPKLPPPAR